MDGSDEWTALDAPAIEHAARLWRYMSELRGRRSADAIVVCCSYDLRVCDYACSLLQASWAPRLVLSGQTGNWTRHLWSQPEARVFRDRALQLGVAPDQIVLEEAATNFGENIAFVRRMLPDIESAIFVTKPAAVLRVALTVPVQWPELEASIDAPPLKFPQEVSPIVGVLGAINEMVGDLDRVFQYPALGFQRAHAVPPDVLSAWQALIAEGFTQHLLVRNSSPPELP